MINFPEITIGNLIYCLLVFLTTKASPDECRQSQSDHLHVECERFTQWTIVLKPLLIDNRKVTAVKYCGDNINHFLCPTNYKESAKQLKALKVSTRRGYEPKPIAVSIFLQFPFEYRRCQGPGEIMCAITGVTDTWL